MDRDRYDRRYDDERRGGESYRPSDRLSRRSPRPDSRFGRPPLRNRSPPPIRPSADTWAPSDRSRPRSRSPGTFRRRSRTPPYRGGDRHPSYNGRPRSPLPPPPPRRFSPRRENGRSPPRAFRRSRSPPGRMARRPSFSRDSSPGLKRGRNSSPVSYSQRSPKRERIVSPPRSRYDRPRSPPGRIGEPRPLEHRQRSPDRRENWREPYPGVNRRRRSPTPPARSAPHSGPGSSSTSRRSSPPSRQDRLNRGYGPSAMQTPSHPNRSYPPAALPPQSPYPRKSSPPTLSNSDTKPARPFSPPKGPRSTLASTPANRPPPGISPNVANHDREGDLSRTTRPPSRGPSLNEDRENKPIPVQPSINNSTQINSPPAGPSAPRGSDLSVRGSNVALLSAPTRPKGASGPRFGGESGPRDSPRGGAIRRPGYGPSYHGPPPGGRGGPPAPSTTVYDSHRPGPRPGNSSSTTFPRSQRFTNHLSGLPTIIPGGKLLPSGLDPTYEKRIAQLEADKERLLEQIAEKQKAKRVTLREWDRLSRESATISLRSDLAENHLQRIAEGDEIGRGAAF